MPGKTFVDVPFSGIDHPVRVYVPSGLPRHRPPPLVLNLHGSTDNGDLQMQISGMAGLAEREKFVVAAPDGAIPMERDGSPAGSWAWNVPGAATTDGQIPAADDRDDVAFLATVLQVVAHRFGTDPSRTYVAGFSGGGRMASALAAEMPEAFAAVGVVAGIRVGSPDPADHTVPPAAGRRPGAAVPVVAFHGTEDPVNPYGGGGDPRRWGYGVEAAVHAWAERNGCPHPPRTTVISEHVTLTAYTSCPGDAAVYLYTARGDGHTWPGSGYPTDAALGHQTDEISASELMWDFFAAHRAPRR